LRDSGFGFRVCEPQRLEIVSGKGLEVWVQGLRVTRVVFARTGQVVMTVFSRPPFSLWLRVEWVKQPWLRRRAIAMGEGEQ